MTLYYTFLVFLDSQVSWLFSWGSRRNFLWKNKGSKASSSHCLFNSDNLIFRRRYLEKYKFPEKKIHKKNDPSDKLKYAILASNSIGEKS